MVEKKIRFSSTQLLKIYTNTQHTHYTHTHIAIFILHLYMRIWQMTVTQQKYRKVGRKSAGECFIFAFVVGK